jgi:predicted transcriptional regulator
MKHMNLSLSEPAGLQKVAHALSNELRLKILSLLDERSMNVLELSQRLNMPISTVSNSITVLEEADLIRTERQSGVRGVSKLCSRKKDNITIQLAKTAKRELESFFYHMPIGAYSDFVVTPTCGLLSHERNIGENDNPATFYDPARFQAQLLWFQQGYVEYRFSSHALMEQEAQCLAIAFEACSEAPNYRKDWPSDITVSINGVELGTWCCPGDFGGRQGRCTPEWWLPSSTQYGLLKRWKVMADGCYLDDVRISDVTLEQLHLTDKPYIAVRIGVKPDAVHQGGINLFGERFGDHNQAIVMRLDCKAK